MCELYSDSAPSQKTKTNCKIAEKNNRFAFFFSKERGL